MRVDLAGTVIAVTAAFGAAKAAAGRGAYRPESRRGKTNGGIGR
jgi:hypothetical protein